MWEEIKDGNSTVVAFSPDGKRLLSPSSRGTAKVWDTETGRLSLTLAGHSREVYGVAWSPNGKHIVTAGSDNVGPSDGRDLADDAVCRPDVWRRVQSRWFEAGNASDGWNDSCSRFAAVRGAAVAAAEMIEGFI